MTGVSYMIPFVAAGGLLIALGFLLGGYEIVGDRTADIAVRQHRSSTCPTPTALGLDHALFGVAALRLPRRAASSPSARPRSASSSRRWPATSPTRSPTAPASRPAS